MKTDKELEDIAYSIIKNFDFEKVLKVMTYLNWKWVFRDENGTESKLPTVADLKETAYSLIDKAYTKNLEFIATGGLRVYKLGLTIELLFCIEDAEYMSDGSLE